ncbi:MAG: helix-turn-helix domain-containing protein [Candidatus Heimdallarchaeaceae archaeon]
MSKEKMWSERLVEEKEKIASVIIGKRRVYILSEDHEKQIKLEELLVQLLAENGPLTREELVKLTNIPRTTLYDNLAKLIAKGIVTKEAIPRKTKGRPKVVFKLT